MKVGTLIKVNGRAATTVSETFTRMVYDADDHDLARSGYEGGTAVTMVAAMDNETGRQFSFILSRTQWEVV